jgi:arylsulfatase A-like enzyme
LSSSHTSIGEVFKNAGYHTAGFHSNPYLSTSYGYNRGFDVFNDGKEDINHLNHLSRKIRKYIDANTWTYNKLRKIKKIFETASGGGGFADADNINQNVQKWIDNNPPEPFFLWIHYMDVHAPYDPPKEYLSDLELGITERGNLNNKIISQPSKVTETEVEILKKLYMGEIRYLDDQIRTLYRNLNKNGLIEDATVVITSDHGEEFGEDGNFLHGGRDAQKASKLIDELLHVPLIIKPGSDREYGDPRTHPGLVGLIDIGPTLLDIAGLNVPDSWKGKPILDPESDSNEVFSEYWLTNTESVPPACSIRTEEFRIIYDGASDEYETISDSVPKDKFIHIKSRLDEHLNEVRETEEFDSSVELSEDQKERLENLGYLVDE